jgi:hypothetical protein
LCCNALRRGPGHPESLNAAMPCASSRPGPNSTVLHLIAAQPHHVAHSEL